MPLNDMDISRLMMYAQLLSSESLGRWDKGLDRRSQVNLRLRRGSLIKTLHWGTKIGFTIKILKEVVMLMRGLGVLVV